MSYTTNPITGRKIKVGGTVYRKLLQMGGANNTMTHTLDDMTNTLKIEMTGDLEARAGDYIITRPPTIGYLKINLGKWDLNELANQFENIAQTLRNY